MKEKVFERREELLDAALNEFTSKSYDEASLNNIIKESGISKGTFYYHFRDKQALYLFLLEASIQRKLEFVNKKLNENPDFSREMDIFEKFKLQASISAEFAVSFPRYHLLSRMFTKEKGNEIYDIAKSVLESGSEKILESMINEAIDHGEFADSFPREFILKVINYMFLHFDEVFASDDDFELNRMLANLDDYVDFMKNGLGRKY